MSQEILSSGHDGVFTCAMCGIRTTLKIFYRLVSSELRSGVRGQRLELSLAPGETLTVIPLHCLACHGPEVRVRSSVRVVPTLYRAYIVCENPECGARNMADVEFCEQLNFPGLGPDSAARYHPDLLLSMAHTVRREGIL